MDRIASLEQIRSRSADGDNVKLCAASTAPPSSCTDDIRLRLLLPFILPNAEQFINMGRLQKLRFPSLPANTQRWVT